MAVVVDTLGIKAVLDEGGNIVGAHLGVVGKLLWGSISSVLGTWLIHLAPFVQTNRITKLATGALLGVGAALVGGQWDPTVPVWFAHLSQSLGAIAVPVASAVGTFSGPKNLIQSFNTTFKVGG